MPDGAADEQYVFLKRPMLSGPNPVGEGAHKYHLIERIQVITEKSDSNDDSDNDSSVNMDSSVSMVVEQEDGIKDEDEAGLKEAVEQDRIAG